MFIMKHNNLHLGSVHQVGDRAQNVLDTYAGKQMS
jgi:hypothetical protein